ncbi:hypothetical protein Cgig2_032852 [Carnegiea gigantea]|uniref:Uncharacterized protein n=1 Tax=Carnegiea gigantea TaxID=171969 RepID=A0A9Q1H0C2_9CARY|nr:hypothetical protein Cgig2_032852 [Carnegiea gigantea]
MRIMQVLVGYISTPLLAMEMELVTNVRSSLRLAYALTLTDREEDLSECLLKFVPASWLRGLIHVVLKARTGDRFWKYCIGNLATDMFIELLHRRQRSYPKLCWMSVFLKHHTSAWSSNHGYYAKPVTLHNKGRISGIIWDSFKATPHSTAKSRQELVDSIRIALLLAFLRSTAYADAGLWDVITPKCLE